MKTNTFHAKKVLMALFAVLLPLAASAQTKVEIDGIWYNLVSKAKQAEVTSSGGTEYSGSITLPTTVTYDGVEYSVTSIGDEAFRGCSSLTAITIPESVTSIGVWAFYRCSSLTTITIPEGVTSIGNSAFYGCSSLTDITIPEGVTSIGGYTFWNCRSLTAITIPEGVTSIGDEAFAYCSSLTAVHISSIEAWCKISFNGNDSNPLSYAHNLYLNGELVTELVIPEGVTSIGDWAFGGCSSLKEVTFGKGLKKIASGSFSECSSIEKVTIHATQPPTTGGYIFDDAVYENATLYVPRGSIAKYQVMTGWSGFYNMSELESSEPDYLTIRQADNGEVGIAVDLGRTYKVRISPSTGWKIHSVTFNDKDMTAQLAADNTFTTPTLTASAVLNVAYVKEGTAITGATVNRIKVQGHQGIISISGTTEGTDISLYTTDGTLVTREAAEDDTTHLTVPTGQVYIVKVADTVVKIGM